MTSNALKIEIHIDICFSRMSTCSNLLSSPQVWNEKLAQDAKTMAQFCAYNKKMSGRNGINMGILNHTKVG